MGAMSSLLTRPATASQYSNPVINSDFPDPICIKVADTFYVFATNFGEMQATTSHIQLATSKDLTHYQIQPDALPILPKWAKPGRTWAPNVTHIQDSGSSTFVLYFVAWDIDSDRQAIGTATSKNAEGPYEASSSKPFILQADQGGSIDPSVFTDDDGKRWLLFKNDGNAVGQTTYIYICPLTPDALQVIACCSKEEKLQLAGEPQVIIQNDQPWEGPVVEAPFMWKHDGQYYLFYSGNGYVSPEYAVGYAVSDCITGPYHKSPKPVVKSSDSVIGPGACCLVQGPYDTVWMLYHSWNPEHTYRAMNIAELKWHGRTPVVHASWGKPEQAPFC